MTFDGSGNNWEIQPNDWFQELPVFQEFTDLPQTTLPADLLFDAVSQQPDGLYPSHLSSYGTSNSLVDFSAFIYTYISMRNANANLRGSLDQSPQQTAVIWRFLVVL